MLKIDRLSKHGAFISMDESNGIHKGGFLSLLNPLVVEALSAKKEEPKPEPLPEPIETKQSTEEVVKPLVFKKRKGHKK